MRFKKEDPPAVAGRSEKRTPCASIFGCGVLPFALSKRLINPRLLPYET